MSFAWATYSRVSREDEGASESDSCARQSADAARFAKAQGATSIAQFTDDGQSGAALDRPGLVDMMTAAKAGRIQRIAIRDVDRLSRDQAHLPWLLFELQRAGVSVVTYRDGRVVSMNGLEGMMTALQGFAAATERQKAGERTRDALRDRARRGDASGRLPVGYATAPLGDGSQRKRIVIDIAKAETVRDIARRFVACNGNFSQVVKSLNKDGLRTPHGKPWAASRVRDTLKNPLYRGIKTHGRRGEAYVAGRKTMVRHAEDTVIRVDVPHLRIFDDALAAKVDKLLAAPRPTQFGGAAKPKHLASRFLRCALCGSAICATAPRYRCRLHHQSGVAGCSGISSRLIAEVDAALIRGLSPFLDGDIAVRALKELRRRLEAEARGDDRAAQEERLHAALAQAERRISNLADALADGDKSPTLRTKLAEEERKAAEARSALTLLKVAAPQRLDVERTAKAAKARLAEMAKLLSEGGVNARPVFEAILGGGRISATPIEVDGRKRWEMTAKVRTGFLLGTGFDSGVDLQRSTAALR